MASHESRTLVNHDEIRQWVEDRGGKPAVVEGTEAGGSALLRVDFGDADEKLQEISWEEFFRIFEGSDLAFVCQDTTKDGDTSRFFKFVSREEWAE